MKVDSSIPQHVTCHAVGWKIHLSLTFTEIYLQDCNITTGKTIIKILKIHIDESEKMINDMKHHHSIELEKGKNVFAINLVFS